MTQDDVTAVSRVERRCFANPWPASAYRRELRNRSQNVYLVLRAQPPADSLESAAERAGHRFDSGRVFNRLNLLRKAPPPVGPHIAGFAGMWCVFDEAHVTTIGVDPIHRGKGFGELLFLALVDEAIRRGASFVTLEVRVSNTVAQDLYRKYGLAIRGRKRGYYSDDGEDAFIMWSHSLREPAYLDRIDELRQQLAARIGSIADVPPPQRGPWVASTPLNVVNIEEPRR